MDHFFKQPDQLPMQEALRLAQTPAGQQLIAMIRQQSGSEFQQAMELASKGDYSQVKLAIDRILTDPQARKLLKELGG